MNSHNASNLAAHFDCQFGAAGDMLLAAILDLAVDRDGWLKEIAKIALPAGSYHVHFEKVRRCSLSANKIEIHIADNPTVHAAHEHTEHGRHLQDILQIIEKSGISPGAKDISSRIFQRLARAEAAVHGIAEEQVHFHEIGAVDAIIDIIGFAVAYDLAGIKSLSASPLPLGSGIVQTEHGIFPVPAPAVLKLLEEVKAPCSDFAIPFECLTPTGAAILCELVQHWGKGPAFEEINSSGYGAGTKDTSTWPNVVRFVSGKIKEVPRSSRFEQEPISVLEANIDDQSPQQLAYAVERIFEAGALDVLLTATVMKKGRSGHLLTVLCKPEDSLRIQETIINETSSLGVRARQEKRLLAERKFQAVRMDDGSLVRIKIASDKNGACVNAHPEFEELADYARRTQTTIKEAQNKAMILFNEQRNEKGQANHFRNSESPSIQIGEKYD